MSRDNIKKVAIAHFIEYGYEGTKLSQIAEEVGMRKQSLSYHFSNKLTLFQEVYRDAVEDEIQFIQQYFHLNGNEKIKESLYQFLTEHKERFQNNLNTQLMQRVMFLVPSEVYKDVIQKSCRYTDVLTNTVESFFSREKFRLSARECALAFVTLLDGLDILLVYKDDVEYEQLQKITWDIFWEGIHL